MTQPDKNRQFEIEKRWRKEIYAAPDAASRVSLYEKAYEELTAYFAETAPEKQDFGYKPGSLLPKIQKLFKSRDVIDYGCGYGLAAMDMAAAGARTVIGFEVSSAMREWAQKEANQRNLSNLQFHPLRQGMMGLAESSADLIFCSDVCEHLHPDDYINHLKEAYRTLRPGGYYYCDTVLKRFGPNDITRDVLGAGVEAQGLHLKEYTFDEIWKVFKQVGFRQMCTPWVSPRFWRTAPWRPVSLTLALEKSFLGRSGLAVGVLDMDAIQLLARKS